MKFSLLFCFFIFLSGCLQESSRGDRKAIIIPTATATPTSTACSSNCDTRPDGDIKINHTFCACEKGLPAMVGNCSATCALTNDTAPTLYLTFSPGTKTLFTNLTLKLSGGNVSGPLQTTENWCKVEIDDGATGVGCLLEATDGTSVKTIAPTTISGDSMTFPINDLNVGRTWVFRLREQASGASTDSAQLFRAKTTAFTPIGPLLLHHISEYSCLTRIGTPGSSGTPASINNTYDNLARLHFYYQTGKTVDALPATANGYNVCHDFQNLGIVDNKSFLRNELIDHSFAVWNQQDSRFATSGSTLAINTEIKNRLLNEYNITADINIFSVMTWPDTLVLSNGTNSQPTTPTLGIIMQAWIDSTSTIQKAFCPNSVYFNSGQAIFRILKDYVGDTEGLYLAQREPETYIDSTGTPQLLPNDFVLIREGQLKKIWFYFDNQTPTPPDDITASQKTLQFYWPPVPLSNPYVKQSQQQLYTVKHPSEISNLTGGPTPGTTIPSDKRFACVPVKGKEGE